MAPTPLAPDLIVLSAIERAELHGSRSFPGAYRSDVVRHLGFDWHSGTARSLLKQLKSLEADRYVEVGTKLRERSIVRLTRRGLTHLQRARWEQVSEAMPNALPESPQHRAWREAHEAAIEGFDRFLVSTTAVGEEAHTLLMDPDGGSSEELMQLGDRLHREFWRLASATYCLREWAEPHDGHGDSEGPGDRSIIWLRPRRDVAGWSDEKLFSGGGR